ncbi:DUF6455 family protein [Bradyrhizobium sp. dw_411]|uniref:DUF6455 family protein n=1 Tax=Bradyrhizobium sp. dw_411 TaxID=2720082 RepID=UPI001BD14543|nr:DUF6455 family protein [Bradyrhizobium sp. dw_411]
MSKRHHPMVDSIADAFGNWLKRRRDIREMREFNSDELTRVASELNVTTADLDTLVHQGPHAADELPTLLTLLGVDKEALAEKQPVVLRDMTRVCTSCQQKRRCDRDLSSGTSAQHFEDYCPNASAIDELRTKAD